MPKSTGSNVISMEVEKLRSGLMSPFLSHHTGKGDSLSSWYLSALETAPLWLQSSICCGFTLGSPIFPRHLLQCLEEEGKEKQTIPGTQR